MPSPDRTPLSSRTIPKNPRSSSSRVALLPPSSAASTNNPAVSRLPLNMIRRRNHDTRKNATRIGNQDVDAGTQFVRSLVDGMKSARMFTGGKPSAPKLATELGLTVRQARRIIRGTSAVPFALLWKRSPKLWKHFFRCLVWHEHKAGRI